jgi:hypothetical protein
MIQVTETPQEWKKYRALIDETSELEYRIIGILSAALSRKEGDGHPTTEEKLQIKEMKNLLQPKLQELMKLKEEVSEFIEMEKALNAARFNR